MSVSVESRSFSGKYGTSEHVGDIIHVQIKVQPDEIPLTGGNKEIIFLIDISGSMSKSIKHVKSSLLAFRDAITQKTYSEMQVLKAEERDNLLRKMNIRIITFSNDAKEIWSNESSSTFEDVIVKLETEAMTNMGDGLKLAFSKINPNRYTWLIVMTDGSSNMGPCKTATAFHRLVTNSKPLNTKIVALGYGENFEPEVLNRVGSFAYVENEEMIPVVLGNLADEIMTAIGFNCTIDPPNQDLDEFDEETIIVPAEGKSDGEIIVGNRFVGPLCSTGKYDYVYSVPDNLTSKIFENKKVTIKYFDILTNQEIIIESEIKNDRDEPTEEIRQLFFRDESKRLTHRVYKFIQRGKGNLHSIKKMIDKWDDEIAQEYKESILKIIEDHENKENNYRENRTASVALNYAIGTGYGNMNSNLGSTQRYLRSPLFDET